MPTCKHKNTTEGTVYCFSHSVAVHPHTDENRAAHGGVTYTETCDDCGAQRQVNSNCGFEEYSPWSARSNQERLEWGWARKAEELAKQVADELKTAEDVARRELLKWATRRLADATRLRKEYDAETYKGEERTRVYQQHVANNLVDYVGAQLQAPDALLSGCALSKA